MSVSEMRSLPAKTDPDALADSLGLTPKERALCDKVLLEPGISNTKAARAVGYAEASAHVTACRVLARDRCKTYLSVMRDEIVGRTRKRSIMKAREVLSRLSDIARSSLRPHLRFNDDGNFAGIDIDERYTDNLREIRTRDIPTKDGPVVLETNIKVADPRPALETLGKWYGLEGTKEEVQPNITVNFLQSLPDDFRLKLWEAYKLYEAAKAKELEGGTDEA
jgi:phage terminase small subunit